MDPGRLVGGRGAQGAQLAADRDRAAEIAAMKPPPCLLYAGRDLCGAALSLDPRGKLRPLLGEARDPRCIRIRLPISLVQFCPAILEAVLGKGVHEPSL